MRLVAVVAFSALVACGGSQRPPLPPAGDEHDDGAGLLARASSSLVLGDTDEPSGGSRGAFGGNAYGGNAYGGNAYGGSTYGGWKAPQWAYNAPNRIPRYSVIAGLTGAIEGTVTWPGAPPPKLSSACGLIDNPSIHIGSDHGVRGVLVFIDKVAIGRPLPYFSRPATVGGIVVKHGCAFTPAAQVVMPLPAALAIHGDATRARVRVTPPSRVVKISELEEAGRITVELAPGITRIDGDDDKLAAAWVLTLESPYYAITDEAGRFRLDELAAGTYDVTFWQPPLATSTPTGVFSYGAPLVVHRTVKVESGRPAHLSIALSGR